MHSILKSLKGSIPIKIYFHQILDKNNKLRDQFILNKNTKQIQEI